MCVCVCGGYIYSVCRYVSVSRACVYGEGWGRSQIGRGGEESNREGWGGVSHIIGAYKLKRSKVVKS